MERIKQGFIKYQKGHKDSKGQSAPYTIVSHETGKILSSHKTEAEAKKHLQTMHAFSSIKSLDQLLKQAEEFSYENEVDAGIEIEKEHDPTITEIYEKLVDRKPTREEMDEAELGITKDHDREHETYYTDPEFGLVKMEKELSKKENGMEDKKSFIGYKNLDVLVKAAADIDYPIIIPATLKISPRSIKEEFLDGEIFSYLKDVNSTEELHNAIQQITANKDSIIDRAFNETLNNIRYKYPDIEIDTMDLDFKERLNEVFNESVNNFIEEKSSEMEESRVEEI